MHRMWKYNGCIHAHAFNSSLCSRWFTNSAWRVLSGLELVIAGWACAYLFLWVFAEFSRKRVNTIEYTCLKVCASACVNIWTNACVNVSVRVLGGTSVRMLAWRLIRVLACTSYKPSRKHERWRCKIMGTPNIRFRNIVSRALKKSSWVMQQDADSFLEACACTSLCISCWPQNVEFSACTGCFPQRAQRRRMF